MKDLKSSLKYMSQNNSDGVYDIAISKYRSALKFFMNSPEYRKELPSGEGVANAA